MTPVDQIIFEDGKGDCLRACVASILDLPVTDVPNWAEDGAYVIGAMEWLKESGIHSLRIDWTGDGFDSHQFISSGAERVYAVVCGLSPRWIPGSPGRRKGHAVVGHSAGYRFEIDHDPHPSRAGLVGNPTHVLWIFKPILSA